MQLIRPTSQPACTTPVLIFQSELAAIEAETLKWPDRETGGELFGYFTHAGWPVVHRVVNANATARRGSVTFHPNVDQINQEGRNLIDRYGMQHLGQWHSHHHMSLTHPSGTDRTTVAEAIRTYGLGSFVQVIANIRERQGSNGALAHAYFYRDRQPDQYESMSWLVLPGASPLGLVPDQRQLSPTIKLEPRVVTWEELRGQASQPVLEGADVPITNQDFLKRLGEEFQLLSAAGVVARGRPAGRHLRIDATHEGRRFVVLLAPDFPHSPPALRRLFDDAPECKLELLWTPDRRIVEMVVPTATSIQEKRARRKRHLVARALVVIRRKHRQLAALVSARAAGHRKGG